MVTPLHKNPFPGGHEIKKFDRPFFGHHYYKLILYEPCKEGMKKIFKEIHQFYTFYPPNYLPMGREW